jgi:hypothetical protein
MQVAEARPPYVSFEAKAVEDREASITSGHYVTKDINYAFITPQGSKDRIERVAEEWFDHLATQVQQQRFPQEWLTHFRAGYTAWKEGKEIPLNGTAILTWPVLSPSQVHNCIDSGLRTIEDLAAANEETINRLGMGGRALKEKAVSWLSAAAGNGKVTEELAALKAAKADADGRVVALEKQLKELQATVAALKK